MKLIVNGDDLGYSPAVNQAIMALFKSGRLNSASLMINLPFTQDAIERIKQCSGLDVGVHLNLTRGRPCLSPDQVPSLVRPDGAFYPSPLFFMRAIAGFIDKKQAKAELAAQVKLAQSSNIRVNHLDSHSHWHIIPHLYGILIELAVKVQVSRVRIVEPRRTLTPNRLWLALADHSQRTDGMIAQTDYMLSLHQWLGEDGEISPLFLGEQMRRLLDRPGVTVELVAHAGQADDPDFLQDTLPAKRRQREFDFLKSPIYDDWMETMHGILQ